MKTRFITFLLALFGAMQVFAQDDASRWVQPDRSKYPDRTYVFAVMSEMPQQGDQIAAFINGECRGVYAFTGRPTVTSANGQPTTLNYEVAPLEVFSTNEEAGTDITFKFSKQGAVYDVTPSKPVAANHLTYGTLETPVSFEMPMLITSVNLVLKDQSKTSIDIHVGEMVDVTTLLDIVVQPSGARLPNNWHWGQGKYFEMNGNEMTGRVPTGNGCDYLYLSFLDTYIAPSNNIPVNVLENSIPVTKIERVTPADKFQTLLKGESLTVTFDVYPQNATNREVTITQDVNCLNIGQVTRTNNGFGKGEFSFTVTAAAAGTSIMTVTTVDGQFNFKMSFTVEEKLESAAFAEPEATYVVGQKYRLPKINTVPTSYKILWNRVKPYTAQGSNFEPVNLSTASRWQMVSEGYDEQGYYFIPRVICNNATLNVALDQLKEPVVQTMHFVKEYTNPEGWGWISLPYTYDFLSKNHDLSLVEVRSYNQQIYHDVLYGWFGDTFAMEPGQGYKQNLASVTAYQVSYSAPKNRLDVVNLHKGWNWIGVPYEYDYSVDYLSKYVNVLPQVEGDILMSKNGFMTFTGGRWQGSSGEFGLLTGEGYLYKSTAEGSVIDWGKQFDMAQPALPVAPANAMKSPNERYRWQYDNSRFATAMAVIGRLTNGADLNAQQYSIGAFVGDECRGEGRILSNGLVLVSLNGNEGDKVRLKLRDEVTGNIRDFSTVIDFNLQAGSVQLPLPLSLKNEATGIGSISGEALDIRVEGSSIRVNGGYPFQVMSADGKQVAPDHLPAGIYLVVVNTPDGPVCQKVIKK